MEREMKRKGKKKKNSVTAVLWEMVSLFSDLRQIPELTFFKNHRIL
jgi:hypothetical protein